MPIFKYSCQNCDEITKVIHMIGEDLHACPSCDMSGSLVRLLNKPYITKKAQGSNTTGEITKKFIEENRKVLEQQKKEIREKTYDET